MTPGLRTLTAIRKEAVADETPKVYTWEETEVTHTFEDGWKIVPIRTAADRKMEASAPYRLCCIAGQQWEKYLADGLILYSLRNEKDEPRACLLFGEANYVLSCRAGTTSNAYASARAFDQHPRCINGTAVISLECNPITIYGPDRNETEAETKRVKEWYEALPRAQEFREFRCTGMGRKDAAEFLRQRKIEEDHGAERVD